MGLAACTTIAISPLSARTREAAWFRNPNPHRPRRPSVIIDADCHISAPNSDALSVSAEELVERMDGAGIDRAIVWLKPPYDRDIDRENRYVYESWKRFPNRLLPFGWATPRLGPPHTRDSIKRCFDEYGFYGVKFNGAQDDYVIDDPDVLPLIEYAASFGKPIAFHIGADSPENTHPTRLGHIAALLPETSFLMSHMGGAALPPLDRAAVEVSMVHPNVFAIGSSIHELAIRHAIRALGSRRVCFGSDEPFRMARVQLACWRALLDDVSAEERAEMLGGNIERLLDLDQKVGS